MVLHDFSQFSYRNNKITYGIYVLMLSLSLFVTIYVIGYTPPMEGTELYFTLPLTFFIGLLSFRHIFPYHEGGMGLKVFFTICMVRYVFMPFFTCYVGTFAGSFSSYAFSYAIIIQDIELLTCFISIHYFFPRQYHRIYAKELFKSSSVEDVSIGGVFVIGIALLAIIIRGTANLASSLRFFIVTDKLSQEDYGGYDRWMAQTMLAFFVVTITSFFQKRNYKKNNILNIIPPLIISFLSCAMVFGNNRMMMVYFALSAISILNVSFPRHRKGLTIVMATIMAIVLLSFTMVKQYSVNISEGETAYVENTGLATTLSEYVPGTEAIAKVYDRYLHNGYKMQLMTPFAEFIDKTPIFHLPRMPMTGWVKGVSLSYRLAQEGGEVIPFAGQTLYYGGYAFGWIFDIICLGIVMLLLVKLDIYSKLETNLGNRYLSTWTSIACGMALCYNPGIIYNAFAYVPFFLWVALMINRHVVMSTFTKTKRLFRFNRL